MPKHFQFQPCDSTRRPHFALTHARGYTTDPHKLIICRSSAAIVFFPPAALHGLCPPPSFRGSKTGSGCASAPYGIRISYTYAAFPESPLSTSELGSGLSRLWFFPGGRGTKQQPFARPWPSARPCAATRHLKRTAGAAGSASSRRGKSKSD